ncbi:hypothetical protein LAZ67_16000376 [Cordylochernes scorpioides]|uniref:Uncharacterized protein n=1 Tax=Cordylochernes scorpioides TaxID=51811 RepID=A0ABY6LAK9_9ARAC|nr:hypothetical protein LAZ67_16000376 [Cordylochernes scorpioides]
MGSNPPYSPDIAPSDYHLFRSMAHGPQGFQNREEYENWLGECVALKPKLFNDGIHKLPKLWNIKYKKVGLEDHAITISSAAKYALYVFFVDREMRGVAGDPLAILHQTLQRWQRRHIHCT